MKHIQQISAVFFSPTGNTKKYVEALAARLDARYEIIDLTDYDTRHKTFTFSKSDLVIFGAPVYAGRLPMVADGIFDRIQGNHTPAVFLVTYGNREFDDSLLELQNTMEEKGFHGVSAGAFIGVHTFCEQAGAGRPNETDYQLLDALAKETTVLIESEQWEKKKLTVDGKMPYCQPQLPPLVPKPSPDCTQCGLCASVCPTKVIDSKGIAVSPENCIACFACVKSCPKQARKVDSPQFAGLVQMLENNLLKQEKTAKIYIAQSL